MSDERLSPSEVKAKRRRLQGRVRISKRDLSELAQVLADFNKLSPRDQEWVRNEIERIDGPQPCVHGTFPRAACAICRHDPQAPL